MATRTIPDPIAITFHHQGDAHTLDFTVSVSFKNTTAFDLAINTDLSLSYSNFFGAPAFGGNHVNSELLAVGDTLPVHLKAGANVTVEFHKGWELPHLIRQDSEASDKLQAFLQRSGVDFPTLARHQFFGFEASVHGELPAPKPRLLPARAIPFQLRETAMLHSFLPQT